MSTGEQCIRRVGVVGVMAVIHKRPLTHSLHRAVYRTGRCGRCHGHPLSVNVVCCVSPGILSIEQCIGRVGVVAVLSVLMLYTVYIQGSCP